MANETTIHNNIAPSKVKQRKVTAVPSGVKNKSRDARLKAAVILEVLAGVRTPTGASTALGVSAAQYYKLEQQAITGLVAACEPRGKGPQPSPEKDAARLKSEVERLQREVSRHQALARASQRAIGLSEVRAPKKEDGKRKRNVKPSVRALKMAEAIRDEVPPEEAAPIENRSAPT